MAEGGVAQKPLHRFPYPLGVDVGGGEAGHAERDRRREHLWRRRECGLLGPVRARHRVAETDARDLEITTHGLEDAFLSLTGRTTSEAGSAARPGPERDSDPELEGAVR